MKADNGGPYEIEDRWCRYIPLLHQILAGACDSKDFPSVSRPKDLFDACALWETLHYLLRQLLGWENRGAGLAWWYANGKPTVDFPLLATVKSVWDQNSELDYYAAWAWTPPHVCLRSDGSSASELAEKSMYHDLDWWREFLQRPKPTWDNPYYGGGNPLHLEHSDWFGCDECDEDCSELYHERSTRRAVLVVNNIGSWRHDLQQAEQKLPDLGERSWYVRVFDRQHGYWGTFRQSRVTGRWFQGKHSIHIQGNPTQVVCQ